MASLAGGQFGRWPVDQVDRGAHVGRGAGGPDLQMAV